MFSFRLNIYEKYELRSFIHLWEKLWKIFQGITFNNSPVPPSVSLTNL